MQYNTTGLWIWYFRIISFHVYPCITSTSTCLMAHAVSQPQVQEMRRVSLNWRWRKLVQHTAVPRPSSEVPAASVVEGFCVQKLRPRSGTRLRLYRHYPCSCGGLNMRKAIYIYMNIMNIHWQYGRPLAGVPCSFGSGAVPKEPSCSTIFARDTAEKNSGFYFLTGEPESLELLVPSLVIPDIERISWEYAIQSWLVICAWLLELVLTNSTAELFKSIQGLQRARKRLASLKKIKTPAACRIWDLVKEVTCKWRLLTSNPNHEGNSNSVTQNPLTAAFSEQKINNWILVHQHSTAAIAFLTIPWFPPHSARGTRNCGATPRECSNSVCKVADARMPNFELWCLILAFYHS